MPSKPQTKVQQAREARYRKQLKLCGFRSWKQANRRRAELIAEGSTLKSKELLRLQDLCSYYSAWKTDDIVGRCRRKLDRLIAKVEKRGRVSG